MERIITFFIIEINDDFSYQAWDKWSELKTNTQKTIKDAMIKKNIINLDIKSRKIIIPINRFDLKTSKWLQIDIGDIFTENKEYNDIYNYRYNLIVKGVNLLYFESIKDLKDNKNSFKILSDVEGKLGFALLPEVYSNKLYPNFKLFIDIENAHVQISEYIYTLLEYIIEIFR